MIRPTSLVPRLSSPTWKAKLKFSFPRKACVGGYCTAYLVGEVRKPFSLTPSHVELVGLVTTNNVLQGGRAEEIFLLQT